MDNAVEMRIRDAIEADLPAIVDIHNFEMSPENIGHPGIVAACRYDASSCEKLAVSIRSSRSR